MAGTFAGALHPPRLWQNCVAERRVQTARRDLLDHLIVVKKRHLQRLLMEFVAYYHDDRTHLALAKETPGRRSVSISRSIADEIVALPRVGGLHHRYERRAAA